MDSRWADGEAGLECKDGIDLERTLFNLWANAAQQNKGSSTQETSLQ